MNLGISSLVYGLASVAMYLIRRPFQARNAGNEIVASRKDAQERLLVGLVYLGVVVLPVLYMFTPLLNFANYRLSGGVVFVGGLVMALSLWLFWRAHADLGRNWSVTLELRSGHTLISEGVYQRIRHPMYASLWLYALGQCLVLPNGIAGPATLVGFGILYVVRVPHEEQMMIAQFGQQYLDYMKVTGRLFPKF